jgi:hypothetical protein
VVYGANHRAGQLGKFAVGAGYRYLTNTPNVMNVQMRQCYELTPKGEELRQLDRQLAGVINYHEVCHRYVTHLCHDM